MTFPVHAGIFVDVSEEIEVLHSLLEKERKVFLSGIAGIGKSELAKAYALQYKKEYTNILYLTYSGDLNRILQTWILRMIFRRILMKNASENTTVFCVLSKKIL